MKIHLYGNVLNNSYNLTQFLRAKGFEAEMFLDDSSSSQQDYPWWEDSTLTKENLPSWVHYYSVNPNYLFPQPELKNLIKNFAKCDIAIVCGFGPIIAYRARIPYFFWSYGSDLTITNLKENILYAFKQLFNKKIPRGLKILFLYSFFQKIAIQKADRIGIGMSYQLNNYAVPLKIMHKVKKIRLAWDIDKYKIPIDKDLYEKYKSYDIVYFMISRHSWKSVWGDLKGNDKFIKAFARFTSKTNDNVKLVMIEKGNDLSNSKKLIDKLGISDYIEWIKEMNKDGIRSYNSLPNVVVVDQFWHDDWKKRFPLDTEKPPIGFGSGSIEALSAGRPLITSFFEEDFYEGNQPPILSAFKEDEIYNRLLQTLELGADGRMKLGEEGRKFVEKYHGWQNTTNLFIETLEEILSERKLKP